MSTLKSNAMLTWYWKLGILISWFKLFCHFIKSRVSTINEWVESNRFVNFWASLLILNVFILVKPSLLKIGKKNLLKIRHPIYGAEYVKKLDTKKIKNKKSKHSEETIKEDLSDNEPPKKKKKKKDKKSIE